MTFFEWLAGFLWKRPPGQAIHLRIEVHMRTVTVAWDVSPTNDEGKPLPIAELAYTEVLLSSDAGKTFTSLAKVKPNDTQTITKDMPDGSYVFRLVETNIYGRSGKPLDGTAVVQSAAPGQVINLKITVS